MESKQKNAAEIEQEMLALNEEFSKFLRTKGIVAKCKLAFADMAESARAQHAADRAQIAAVKQETRARHEAATAENATFLAFLHTKGLRAKVRFVIESIKKGAAEAPAKTAAAIAAAKAGTAASTEVSYDADALAREFNAFLASRGLDTRYTVTVSEAE